MQVEKIIVIVFVFIILSLTLLIGLIMAILLLNQKRHQGLRSQYDRELLQSQIEIYENTLQQISREIHDNIGQYLSLASFYMHSIKLSRGHPGAKALKNASDLNGKALDDLRDLSKSLSLELIRSGGLTQAMESLVDQLKRTERYDIEYQVVGTYEYQDEQLEIFLFRILQEGVTNIIRHAKATRVNIALNCVHGAHMELVIHDNGTGLDPAKYAAPGKPFRAGGGMYNMRMRTLLLNGNFHVETAPGKGTTISITVPKTNHDASKS